MRCRACLRACRQVAEAAGSEPLRRRVFFGLKPDAPEAIIKATRRAVRAGGGRPVKPENLHLTLAFLGALAPAEVAAAAAVPPVSVGPFELELDRLGFFARSRVLWLAPSVPPAELLELERGLWAGLEAVGFTRERGLFRPHVTLARKGAAVAEPIKPVQWRAHKLCLFESLPIERGVRYARLDVWPL